MRATLVLMMLAALAPPARAADPAPLPQAWEYAAAMKAVAAKANGAKAGVVLHVGDSITYSNPYGQWARGGAGQTPDDKAALKWMHAGQRDDSDGWHLAAFDHPAGGRSHTACSGITLREMLDGGPRKMPPLARTLDTYKPQAVVLMLGTNDASRKRDAKAFAKDFDEAVALLLGRGIVPIVSTIPPHPGQGELAKQYNETIRKTAEREKLPLIDYEREILARRPSDWNGTLLGKNDVHPAGVNDVAANAAPTEENLKSNGYLLRGWLSVRKIAEVKRLVFDGVQKAAAGANGGRDFPNVATPAAPVVPAPVGETVRLPVTRDARIPTDDREETLNIGGSSQLRLKSYQELSLFDVDTSPLKGRVINGATLHLHLAGKERLWRVTVGTVSSPWAEGKSDRYGSEAGASTFVRARHPDVAWAYPGSDLTAVIFGQGGSLWAMADAQPPDAGGWQRVAVEPAVVAARVAGASEGFVVFDDTGSEWTRDGERFELSNFPNRSFHSRDSRRDTAPYLTVYLGARDDQPPAAPTELRSDVEGLPAGEARLTWRRPADAGGAGVAGYRVTVDGKPAPRYLIPAATGETATMRLRDLGLGAGQRIKVSVAAVDGAGNVGPAAGAEIATSARAAPALPGTPPEPIPAAPADPPRLGGAEVAVIDLLDKVHPVTGTFVPPQPAGYVTHNHLWDAGKRHIRLTAARNEFVAFQVLFRGAVANVRPSLTFENAAGAAPTASFARFRHVATSAGPMPDPVVPLGAGGAFDVLSADERIAGQTCGAMLCEVYVPHDAAPGERRGTLMLAAGDQRLAIDVVLTVFDFTLSDRLSFLPEMNTYGLPREGERDCYRVAHRHRTALNRVPYSQSGNIDDGCAPGWDGARLDFAEWDRRFGPLLDGSAFADLPRKGVPLEAFYLPLHENWPTPIDASYNGSYWADAAFSADYRKAFVEASRQFAQHAADRGWDRTLFHGFLNNKRNYKERGWSRGTSPWLLDEPAHWQDFWALRWFGLAFHEGVNRAAAPNARLLYRADVSRPQWQRDSLDAVLDYNVVAGGAFTRYRRMVLDRKEQHGQIVMIYGTTNDPAASNVQPAAWCLDGWTLGADGVLPWQTVGRRESWETGSDTALFYPGNVVGSREPIPSVRLKAYTRGQQDVEYLAMLAAALKVTPAELGPAVRDALRLSGERRGTGFTGDEDAGVITFDTLRPQDLWALRTRVGRVLSEMKGAAAPPPLGSAIPR